MASHRFHHSDWSHLIDWHEAGLVPGRYYNSSSPSRADLDGMHLVANTEWLGPDFHPSIHPSIHPSSTPTKARCKENHETVSFGQKDDKRDIPSSLRSPSSGFTEIPMTAEMPSPESSAPRRASFTKRSEFNFRQTTLGALQWRSFQSGMRPAWLQVDLMKSPISEQ